MIVLDTETKLLDTETFLQHIIIDLNSGITFVLLFSQEKPLMVNGNKHTHTHTISIF